MDYEMIGEFFKNYGWQLTLLAFSGIIVLGFLKWIGVFKNLKADNRKYVYYALSCGLSIVACTIYILATKSFAWASYGILCGAVVCFTGAVYTIYENTGLRKLWKTVVLNNIAKLFKLICNALVNGTLTQDKIKDLAIGLGSETLSELTAEAKTIEESKNTNTENAEIVVEQVNQ